MNAKTIIPLLFSMMAWNANAVDFNLWYNKPAAIWQEALPVGNGSMGAMVYGRRYLGLELAGSWPDADASTGLGSWYLGGLFDYWCSLR